MGTSSLFVFHSGRDLAGPAAPRSLIHAIVLVPVAGNSDFVLMKAYPWSTINI
jgi:hypothetical protein